MKMGEREKQGAASLHQGEARLHGGNADASLTSKASDFILSTNCQQSEAEGFFK